MPGQSSGFDERPRRLMTAQEAKMRWLAVALALLYPCMLMGEQKANAPRCVSVTVEFTIKAGEGFSQELGDLTFDVRPDMTPEEPNGWTITIYASGGDDLIAPVNLPLRFNPSQILGPGYGLSAGESLKTPRELPFLLSDGDYRRVAPLWRGALWPSSAPDPDRAAEIFSSTIASMPLGLLKLKTLKADISAEDIARSANFEARFIVPSEFHLDLSLKPRPSTCPLSHK